MDDKLFINLKILGKIQKNGKICRSSNGIIALENENFYLFLKRFVTSDSRKQSLFEINSIINETIRSFENIINSKFMNKMYYNTDDFYKGCENINLILKELRLVKIGISNLQFTYKLDVNITSQLDILIIKIESTIKDMEHKLTYFNSFLPVSHKLDIETPKQKIPHDEPNWGNLDNTVFNKKLNNTVDNDNNYDNDDNNSDNKYDNDYNNYDTHDDDDNNNI